MDAQKFQLDYFRFYDVANLDVGEKIKIKGQFDKDLESAKLFCLTAFAAPASKNGERMFDENSHFNWYQLREAVPDPMRKVAVENQFGRSALLISSAFGFLAPTHKIERGSEPPKRLDHFKIYRIIDFSPPPQKTLTLKDQFFEDKVDIFYPFAFAVPVFKQHGRVSAEAQNPDAHLVIYRITPHRFAKPIRVKDQFDRYDLKPVYSFALGAPSKKLRWVEVSEDSDLATRGENGPWEG